jgi:hypothetical protein
MENVDLSDYHAVTEAMGLENKPVQAFDVTSRRN